MNNIEKLVKDRFIYQVAIDLQLDPDEIQLFSPDSFNVHIGHSYYWVNPDDLTIQECFETEEGFSPELFSGFLEYKGYYIHYEIY